MAEQRRYAFKGEKQQNEGRRRLCFDKAITVNVKECFMK